MRRPAAVFTSVLLISLASFADNANDIVEIGKQPVVADFASGKRLRMDLCSSGVEIRGTDENKVNISFEAKNGNYDNVKVKLKASSDEATLEIHGCPHNNFQVVISVPKLTGLYVRMPAGQLEVHGVTGDKDMELHAGELDVDIGSPADYARVDASVITGEVDASPFNVSKGGFFRSFKRLGGGKYRLHAHVGTGQIDLN